MEAISTPTTGTTAAPATASAPSATAAPTPVERPTFAQAFASDAATSPEQPAQPEAPTTQAADAATTQAPVNPNADAKTGPIPFEVHKTALENARTKGAAEYKEKFGWAENLDRSLIEETTKIGTLYRNDKPAFFRQLLAEAAGNPETLAVLRSESARFLAGARQQPAAVDLTPDIPVVDDQGRVVSHSFSAERVKQLLKQERDSLKQELLGEIAPLKQDRETAQRQEQARQEQAHLQSTVTTLYEQATTDLPHFKEHEQEIAAAFEKIPGDPGTALYRAYAQVVIPKLNAASQAKALDDLKTKAAASTANPASAAVATAKRPKSFNDPALTWT
jgi:hypothetical protein